MLESDPRPWLTNPSIRRTFFPEPHLSTDDIPELKGLLRQLQPGPPGRVARMLLSAAQKAPAASVVSPKHSRGEPGPSHPKSADHCPTQVLSQIGRGQQEQGKDSTDLRPETTMVSRPPDSVPFVQAPSASRLFPYMQPLVERAPHPSQRPPLRPPQHLCCAHPPQRAHHLPPGSSALFAVYSS